MDAHQQDTRLNTRARDKRTDDGIRGRKKAGVGWAETGDQWHLFHAGFDVHLAGWTHETAKTQWGTS